MRQYAAAQGNSFARANAAAMDGDAFDAVLFDLFGTLVDEQGQAIQGARDILRGLPPTRWAIVTSCSRGLAEGLVRRAGLPVPPCIVTSQDVRHGKPAPEGYLLAAARLSVRPDRCLVIEDSAQGIAAGVAAGMTVLGIGSEVAQLRDLAIGADENGTLLLRR